MSLQGWQETLITAQSDGPALASFTTATTALPTAARYKLPANTLAIGKQYRILATGRISNVVTAQPFFTWQVQAGPTSNITVFTTGGALTCSTTAHTNIPWWIDILLTCRSIGGGTAATFMGQGIMHSQAFINSGATPDGANTHTMLMAPNIAPAVGTGFDSTVDNWFDLFIACSASNAANAVTVHQYSLQSLN